MLAVGELEVRHHPHEAGVMRLRGEGGGQHRGQHVLHRSVLQGHSHMGGPEAAVRGEDVGVRIISDHIEQ